MQGDACTRGGVSGCHVFGFVGAVADMFDEFRLGVLTSAPNANSTTIMMLLISSQLGLRTGAVENCDGGGGGGGC